MTKVMTANRLTDGKIVYIAPGDGWVETIRAARLLESDTDAEAAMAAAQADVKRNLVVDPLPVEVEVSAEGPRALSLRNAIRAAGPTIAYHGSTYHGRDGTVATEKT